MFVVSPTNIKTNQIVPSPNIPSTPLRFLTQARSSKQGANTVYSCSPPKAARSAPISKPGGRQKQANKDA